MDSNPGKLGHRNPKKSITESVGQTPLPKSPFRHYIGTQRPQVTHIKEEPLSYDREHEAKLAEGDFTDLDNGF